ncbi:MAG: putative toxin-antitoxin system toxin component, PIN family [Candidatus Omnitrophica bacterium]|nr:putative toxin-antitoxin system toxin component, PIN family [Candidatus Omnitrophota bacterium]
MRVILDTNIFVSGLLVRESIPGHILHAFLQERFLLLISLEIMAEILEVLSRPRFNLKREKILEVMHALELKAEKVTPPSKKKGFLIPEDQADEKFLLCAAKGKADYLVSGDIHLIRLKSYESAAIVTPREFINILNRT